MDSDNKSLANWLIVMFIFMYWIFRMVVAYMYSTSRSFITTPLDFNVEIILLFVTLFCMILMIKRVKLAAIIYAGTYIMYFGVDLYNKIMPMLEASEFNIGETGDLLFSGIGVILAILALLDVLIDKVKAPVQVQTDWFYENKDYDRKVDDRSDRIQYRT